MAKGRTALIKYVKPLVDSPKAEVFRVVGHDCEVEITVNACPDNWILYSQKWIKTPPAGLKGVCEGQVTLICDKDPRKIIESAPKIRAESNNVIYPGSSHNGLPGSRFRSRQLHLKDRIRFHGELFVEVG